MALRIVSSEWVEEVERDRNIAEMALKNMTKAHDRAVQSYRELRDSKAEEIMSLHAEIEALKMDKAQPAAGMSVRQTGRMIQGIDADLSKRISKDIRDMKIKVKPTIEGDKLRVSSASKDALQSVIAMLREKDYGQPLQFTNYR